MHVEIIIGRPQWQKVLHELREYDFVHTYDFHVISSNNGEGEPLLFVVKDVSGAVLACWPTLKRIIPGTSYADLTSVYGYGGPLFAEKADSICATKLLLFSMREVGAISLFSRMHPLFINRIDAEGFRGERLGDVVVLNTLPSGSILSGYRGSHRREIVNSLKQGLALDVDLDCSCLDSFISIYQGAMRDLGASDSYFFDDVYFRRLSLATEFKVLIVSASFDRLPIASSMFIVTNGLMHYYLSGSNNEYRRLSPSKAIIAKAHELAAGMGVSSLMLGGGLGSQRDALFDFKAGFSKTFKPFYIFKHVFNDRVYQDLCRQCPVDSKSGFFPAYRCNHAQ